MCEAGVRCGIDSARVVLLMLQGCLVDIIILIILIINTHIFFKQQLTACIEVMQTCRSPAPLSPHPNSSPPQIRALEERGGGRWGNVAFTWGRGGDSFA